jgi:hypothetical protein
MTTIFGYALDRESGDPLVWRQVSATLRPSSVELPPMTGGQDRAVTDIDGRWELTLPPNSVAGSYYSIRVWRHETIFVVVPDSPTPVNAETIDVDPDTLEPPEPADPPLYVARSEIGTANGVAGLDDDGRVPLAQLPASSGGGLDETEVQAIVDDSIEVHVVTPEPHPAYDDLPSLTLIFQNGLV